MPEHSCTCHNLSLKELQAFLSHRCFPIFLPHALRFRCIWSNRESAPPYKGVRIHIVCELRHILLLSFLKDAAKFPHGQLPQNGPHSKLLKLDHVRINLNDLVLISGRWMDSSESQRLTFSNNINPKMDMQKIITLDGFGVRADPRDHYGKKTQL